MRPQPPPDEAAILRAAVHDLNRFAPIYERYVDRIYVYCLRRAASAADAEDLTSLIFTRAMIGVHDYRGGSVAAWLFRIAHNTIVNYYRDRRAHAPLTEADEVPVEQTPADSILDAESEQMVRRLVTTLPQEAQHILWLRMSGLSSSEIGDVIGKSAGAVRTDLYRLLKTLRARFTREFEA